MLSLLAAARGTSCSRAWSVRWLSHPPGLGAPRRTFGRAAQSSDEAMDLERSFSAHNYHPLPVVFATARNATVVDPEGRTYLDFLSAYSAVNTGHSNPKILAALQEQSTRCTLSSRAFYNDQFGSFAKLVSEIFGYESMLPMNTGAEAVETALKLSRKWGYMRKGIPPQDALVISCCGCFHGRTFGAVAMSCDPQATEGFGPVLPGHLKVDFGDTDVLARVLEEHGPRVCAFVFEPIQGEAGVVVPPPGYLARVRELCTKHNVLMVADEVQTGICRTGRMLACDWEGVRPDVVVLGKAISGGVLPVSAVLANASIMHCIQPGEHGSTFGGNPLSSAVARAALEFVVEERLAERADRLGASMLEALRDVQAAAPPGLVKTVRGKGLLNAVVVGGTEGGEGAGGVTAYDVCMALKIEYVWERGVLAKPTQQSVIRLAPPLTIDEPDLWRAVGALKAVLTEDLPALRAAAEGRPSPPKSPPCARCGRVMDH